MRLNAVTRFLEHDTSIVSSTVPYKSGRLSRQYTYPDKFLGSLADGSDFYPTEASIAHWMAPVHGPGLQLFRQV